MKGWKTLGFALAVAVVGVVQAFDWATVIPDSASWKGVALLTISAVVAGLRVMTTTPVGEK